MKMRTNKFRSELKRFKEYAEEHHPQYLLTIPGLVGWLEGGKIITKDEADFIMELFIKSK